MATVYFITLLLDLARHFLFLVTLDNIGLVVVSDIFHSIFLNLCQANAEEKLEEKRKMIEKILAKLDKSLDRPP